MAKKTISISAASITANTTYYTCPSSTIAKVISYHMTADGYLKIIGTLNSSESLAGFRPPDVTGTTPKSFYLAAGEMLKGQSSTGAPWTLILVEESLGVQ